MKGFSQTLSLRCTEYIPQGKHLGRKKKSKKHLSITFPMYWRNKLILHVGVSLTTLLHFIHCFDFALPNDSVFTQNQNNSFLLELLKKKTELDTMHNRLQDGNNKLFVQNYTDEYFPFFFGLDWKQLPRRLWEWPPCCCHHRLSGRWMWWTLTIISMTSLGIGETSPSMTCCRNVLDDGCA